jgi:hypothetical protein
VGEFSGVLLRSVQSTIRRRAVAAANSTNPNSKFSRSTAWPVHARPRADHSPSACTDDALTQGDCRSLGSIRDLQLGTYVVDMIPYRVMTNLKDPGNFFVGQPS